MRNHIAVLTFALCATVSVAAAQQAKGVGASLQAPRTAPAAHAAQPAVSSSALKPAAVAGAAAARDASGASVSAASTDPATEASASTLEATNTPQVSTVRMLPAQDVITDDDLNAMRSGVAINYLWTETKVAPAVNPALCDRDCEAETRAAAGMARSPNREWQDQFMAARIDLAADKQWRAAYIEALQKAQQYCVFRGQENAALWTAPGSTSGEREQYVGDMNQELGQNMDSAAAQIQQEIERVERVDSVRAAMMEVLAERAFNQCSSASRR